MALSDPIDAEAALAQLGQFPHCDARVLHAPGTCRYCDERAEWQALRILWRINFTGQKDSQKTTCPAERERSVEDIHAWTNNRPEAPDR